MELRKMEKKFAPRVALLAAAGIVLTLVASLQWGCSDRVKGTSYVNQKPVAYFVNVPPDSSRTSRNPLVHWVGADADGQVRQFRYHVVLDTVLTRGHVTPLEYARTVLLGVPTSQWIYLDVVADPVPDPQTQGIVRMSASLDDPVNTFIPQYIYLQAIDDKGAFSEFAWKIMFRNDNPPETYAVPIDYDEFNNPFINAKTSGGLITGVRLRWYGEDLMDYPVDPPPFQFQWKMFGPYAYDTITGGEWKVLVDSFTAQVFVTNDAKIYRKGNNDSILIYCDSVDTASGTIVSYVCEKIMIDTISASNNYGRLERMFLVDDPAFLADTMYRFVDSSKSADLSGWVEDVRDTLFNVYRNKPQEATTQMRFLFWVRCRDDANVADLVPWYGPFGVIEPKYEREVIIIDFTKLSRAQRHNAPQRNVDGSASKDSAYVYWKRAMDGFAQDVLGQDTLAFDSTDYVYLNGLGDNIDLARLLQHKVIIAYNDDTKNSNWYGNAGVSRGALKIYKAIDAGVNVWFLMRAPFRGDFQDKEQSYNPLRDRGDFQFVYYFPLDEVRYTGWSWWAGPLFTDTTRRKIRIEDFTGGQAINDASYPHPGWPDVNVDSVNLHWRLNWNPSYPLISYRDSLPYYPEVGWVVRRRGTDPLYLYRSHYGANHPLGASFSYEGSPVAFRYGTSLFRTAFFCFTPLAMEDGPMQIIIDSVMGYLYDDNLEAPAAVNRYPDAQTQIRAADIQANDRERAAIMSRLYGKDRE